MDIFLGGLFIQAQLTHRHVVWRRREKKRTICYNSSKTFLQISRQTWLLVYVFLIKLNRRGKKKHIKAKLSKDLKC